MWQPQLRFGRGLVIPRAFVPPVNVDDPAELFKPLLLETDIPDTHRLVNENDRTQLLIYAGGSSRENGGLNRRAGCAFVFRALDTNPDITGFVAFPLEMRGPMGLLHARTINRAELRAVIAALRAFPWYTHGFSSLVIATDSLYAVDGITRFISEWVCNGWMISYGTSVNNQDLWQCLLGDIERLDENGMEVQFWLISKAFNEADLCATAAAVWPPPEHFLDYNFNDA